MTRLVTDNLYGLLDRSFVAAGGKTAIRTPENEFRLTYVELRRAVSRYANALVALGVEPGQRISVQAEKSVSGVLLYLASLKAGAVYQPLNPAYTESETDYFIGDAEPRVIVCDASRLASMRRVGERHKVVSVIALDGAESSLTSLAGRMDEHHETVARAASDLAGLLYTSGTTGKSKGAMITHGNLASNALTLLKLWSFRDGDRLLHALPIFHVHGLFVALNTTFLSGAEIIWLEKFDVGAVIAALPQASLMMGVPTFYTRLLASPDFTVETCRHMRLFISGSAPLLAETHRHFSARTGHTILERYGMTETGMIASNPYDGQRIAGTVGFSLPDVSVRIAGAQPGVLEVKGPNVFKGYWRRPEATAEAFTEDGYFVTGDVGTIDADGRISIVGRASDVIISGGLNVYPREIEAAIDALPGVAESAVVGVPHPDFGEGVIAAVTARGPLAPEALMIAELATRLAGFKVPKRILLMDELPRNAMGKVEKGELRRRYQTIFGT
ncbi:MAG: AMP-binding protein [Aestuariivirga sp.]